MITNRWTRVLTLCVAGLVGMPANETWARAPAPASAQDEATRHYEDGMRLFEGGEFQAAARAFEAAYALVPDAALLYNLALAWEEAGDLDQALDALRRYAETVPPEETEDVETQLRSLENRIAKRDAAREDPGDAAGVETSAAAPRTPSGSTADPSGDPTRDRSRADRKPRVFTPLAGAFLGLGVAGLATGLGLGIQSRSHVDAVRDACAELESGLVCPASVRRDERRARLFAIGADAAYALGGAAIVGTIIVLAIHGARLKKQRRKQGGVDTAWTPELGPTRVGLTWTARF